MRSCAEAKNCTREMHPWLAGAQYRTTAVVLVYRLISLIGPHCPASTYSSTCPFLSMHFVVHGREKERGNVVGMRKREREREKKKKRDKLRACVCTHGHRCSAIGTLFAKYLPGLSQAQYQTGQRTIRVRPRIPKFSNPLFTWIGTDTCLLDLDTGRGRGGYGGDESDRGQYRISLAGVLWKFRSSDPLDTMIGGLDTIEIAAPVPYVSATFLDSHAGAMDRRGGRGGEVRGSLAVPPLNMEESQITIRRVRSGLGEFRCHNSEPV
ncbi:Uncharacterized protein DBV15_10009 [Temnothorax longispinosus]|uniref:Uncharacterized protein n=1 Tax=Temnothorax longispinosus TaxID=300112 RepID=A0A4S2KR26_9HYME|nr:Uncharacterized protein DBV15_10009 [Temnothorax longispinosus]